MRYLLLSLPLFVACGANPSSTAVTTASGTDRQASKALCGEATTGQSSAVFADTGTFAAKVRGYEGTALDGVKALCALPRVRCEKGGIITSEAPDDHLSVTTPDGVIRHYRLAFGSGSGAGCEWEPQWSVEARGRYVLITQSGRPYERKSRECVNAGIAFSAAIVDTAGGRLLGEFSCQGEAAGALPMDEGIVTYTSCEDVQTQGPVTGLNRWKRSAPRSDARKQPVGARTRRRGARTRRRDGVQSFSSRLAALVTCRYGSPRG